MGRGGLKKARGCASRRLFAAPLARIVKLTRKCHAVGTAKPQFGGREAEQTLTFLGLLAKIKCSICSYQCDN